MDTRKKVKMAIIAGASKALKYKAEDWKMTDDEILRKISNESSLIADNIDTE